jgi:RNA polymerase sigma factor (sigma-70 family)
VIQVTVEERNEWIVDNQRLIHKICQKWRYRRDYEDIVQTAFVAAIKALDRSQKGCDDKALRGYISLYIEGHVMNYCIKKDCIVTLPRYYYDKGVRLEVMSIDYEYNKQDFEELYLSDNENGYEVVDVMTDFENAISGLDDHLKRTARMLAAGYERKDIQKVEKCSQQAISLRIQKIRRQCQKLYA